jgi:hypothetical protein
MPEQPPERLDEEIRVAELGNRRLAIMSNHDDSTLKKS